MALRNAHFGQGTGPIHLDNVHCSGREESIFDCSYLSYHNCGHYEDASVQCPIPECNNTEIRLVGGSQEMEGRVEVCYGGKWGTICDNSWDTADARVVCNQLGYPSGGTSL